MVELVRAFQRGVSFPPLGVVIWVIGVDPRSAAVHLRMDLSSLALSLSGICAAEDEEREKGTGIIHTACSHISELYSCCIPIQAATQRPFAPPLPPHTQTNTPPPHTNTQARDGHMQTRSHSTSAASCASRTAHKCTPRTTQVHVGCASMQYPPNHGTYAPTYNGDSLAAISSPSISAHCVPGETNMVPIANWASCKSAYSENKNWPLASKESKAVSPATNFRRSPSSFRALRGAWAGR